MKVFQHTRSVPVMYNEYSDFRDITGWYEADLLEKEDLLEEEFQDIIPQYDKQELMIEEYQTMPEEQINLELFISYYYYINARPKDSSRRRKTKEFKRLSNHRLSSYVNDDSRIFVYPEPDVLYREEKEVVRGERDEQDYYPLEIVRSNDLVRIITQIPVVGNKRNIKVKIYNDTSIEISVNDDDTLQKNKKYYRMVEIPKDADIKTAKCTYRNGILEITFKQKKIKRKRSSDE